MQPSEREVLVGTLEAMRSLELAMAEFYGLCAEVWHDEEEMWRNIERAELQHAEYVEKISGLLRERPERFEQGCLVDPVVLREETAGLRDGVRRMRAGLLGRREILRILGEAEQSVLERRYTDMLVSQDLDYIYWISEIVSQTETHRQFIARKVEELTAGGAG